MASSSSSSSSSSAHEPSLSSTGRGAAAGGAAAAGTGVLPTLGRSVLGLTQPLYKVGPPTLDDLPAELREKYETYRQRPSRNHPLYVRSSGPRGRSDRDDAAHEGAQRLLGVCARNSGRMEWPPSALLTALLFLRRPPARPLARSLAFLQMTQSKEYGSVPKGIPHKLVNPVAGKQGGFSATFTTGGANRSQGLITSIARSKFHSALDG